MFFFLLAFECVLFRFVVVKQRCRCCGCRFVWFHGNWILLLQIYVSKICLTRVCISWYFNMDDSMLVFFYYSIIIVVPIECTFIQIDGFNCSNILFFWLSIACLFFQWILSTVFFFSLSDHMKNSLHCLVFSLSLSFLAHISNAYQDIQNHISHSLLNRCYREQRNKNKWNWKRYYNAENI